MSVRQLSLVLTSPLLLPSPTGLANTPTVFQNNSPQIPSLKEELQILFQGPRSLITGRPYRKILNILGRRSLILCFPYLSCPPSTPSSMMSTTFPPPQPRGIDHSLPTCGETQCNSHGTCVIPLGGGGNLVCDCDLGYRGEFCEDTVNGALSVPLTLSVVGVIIGLLILAFVCAKLRQRQKKKQRRNVAEKFGYNIAV